jgi:hypothetical protein
MFMPEKSDGSNLTKEEAIKNEENKIKISPPLIKFSPDVRRWQEERQGEIESYRARAPSHAAVK